MPICNSIARGIFLETDGKEFSRRLGQRLEFVEFRLFWEGGVNRSDIMGQFGVSMPQASTDLADYKVAAPDNVAYDPSSKRYVPTPSFQPRFLRPNPDRYLAQLKALDDGVLEIGDTWLASRPESDALPIPSRRTDPVVLRAVLMALRNRRAVHVNYQSSSPEHPEPIWRWIDPHAFGFDGFRWHVRAFCHRDHRFKDFILGRCLAVGEQGSATSRAEDDLEWQEFFSVQLKPNPDLSKAQRRAIELDYNMEDGQVSVRVRYALLYYFHKRLRLDVARHADKPRERPVVVANEKEYKAALKKAGVPLSPSEKALE